MLSMTGYGVGQATLQSSPSESGSERAIVVELRSVNHRYLDIRSRLPQNLSAHTSAMEKIIKQHALRGRVEAHVSIESAQEVGPVLDLTKARAVLAQLKELHSEWNVDTNVPAPFPMDVLKMTPGLFSQPNLEPDHAEAALLEATQRACEALTTMRQKEGASLSADLAHQLSLAKALVDKASVAANGLAESVQARLHERVNTLLGSLPHPQTPQATDVASQERLDRSRLEQEVAIIADRADIAEELTRLRSHFAQFAERMQETRAGKPLDFLLQEMARETNTIGSKSTDLELKRIVIDLKTIVERLREQVQNVV